MSRLEKQSFLESAPAYLRHWAAASAKNHSTCLAKIFGVFQVIVAGEKIGCGL